MNPKKIEKSKLKIFNNKQLLIPSLIGLFFAYPTNLISQPLTKPKLNEVNIFSKKSFITKAVEKTGSSVVTIDTQRYIKKRKFPRNSQLFIDPYFERFFGFDFPEANLIQKIFQNMGLEIVENFLEKFFF